MLLRTPQHRGCRSSTIQWVTLIVLYFYIGESSNSSKTDGYEIFWVIYPVSTVFEDLKTKLKNWRLLVFKMREIFVFRKDTGGCLGLLLFKSVRAWHCLAMRCNWTKKSVHQWYTKCLHQWYRRSRTDLKPTGFQFPLGKFGDGSDSWHYQHRRRRQFWCLQLCCLGSSWRELLGVQRHTDKGTNPETWIWGFFHWLNCFYPRPQGWCSWIPALRQAPHCKPAGNLGNFWCTKSGLLGLCFFFF